MSYYNGINPALILVYMNSLINTTPVVRVNAQTVDSARSE
jgi:hypothetical protein